MSQAPFLTAEWRRLAIVTFAVSDELVETHIPAGTEPDRWNGSALASVVAFEFLRMRVKGLPAVGLRSFPEWNLRLYVREEGEGGRRGVTFVRELVPSRLVALVAQALYNEPYRAVKYACSTRSLGEGVAVEHVVYGDGRRHRFGFVAGGELAVPPVDSLSHFLKEHEWGGLSGGAPRLADLSGDSLRPGRRSGGPLRTGVGNTEHGHSGLPHCGRGLGGQGLPAPDRTRRAEI